MSSALFDSKSEYHSDECECDIRADYVIGEPEKGLMGGKRGPQ